jgi:NADH:ubiquinone oxidoreductase subunit 6 (subunit J)
MNTNNTNKDNRSGGDNKKPPLLIIELIIGFIVIVALFYFQFNANSPVKTITEKIVKSPVYVIALVVFLFIVYMLLKGVKNFKENSLLAGQWRILIGLLLLAIIVLIIFL